jgi:hypothetical protein
MDTAQQLPDLNLATSSLQASISSGTVKSPLAIQLGNESGTITPRLSQPNTSSRQFAVRIFSAQVSNCLMLASAKLASTHPFHVRVSQSGLHIDHHYLAAQTLCHC